ncbi:hypothetical protein [Halosolutus halophilus]|uniref:hypothetical protein n=1 Tax=Halosolutus halophilus TaxID=1552990 RepID=UPI002235301C|nr:hypothetical protein [Halosolutus halophilus]
MSTTTTTHETISEESAETEPTQIDLSTIAAQTTSTVDALPDWEVHNAACHAVRDTLKRAVETEGI